MNHRRTTLAAALAAAVCAALAGCSLNADATPITSTTPTGTATTTSAPSSSTTTTLDAAAKEKQDRADAEAVWHKFQTLIITSPSLSQDEAEQAFEQVAVDPQLSMMRSGYATLKARGETGYGAVISFITWRQPINGADTATLYDCQDGSQTGYYDIKTGNKLTVGTPNTPSQGSLQRTPQGWRVVDALTDQVNKCTPGV